MKCSRQRESRSDGEVAPVSRACRHGRGGRVADPVRRAGGDDRHYGAPLFSIAPLIVATVADPRRTAEFGAPR